MADAAALPNLLDHAKCLYGLLGADDILRYLCRQARVLTGATRALCSYVPAGEPWPRARHVVVDDDSHTPTASAISAAFAVFRRCANASGPFELPASDETIAVYRGLGADSATDATVWTVPLRNRRHRLVGQLILVVQRDAIARAATRTAVADLADLVAVALEGAHRLAFARRDQDRLLLLAEATEEALWDWDLETNAFWWGGGIQNVIQHGGVVIGANAAWKFERIHPLEQLRVRTALDEALRGAVSSWRAEFRFRRGDGSWAIVEDRGYFLRDAEGRAYRMIGAMRDISARKRVEAQQEVLVGASAVLAESLEVEKNLRTVATLAASSVADWCAVVLFEPDVERPRAVAVARANGDESVAAVGAAIEAHVGAPGGFAPALRKTFAVAEVTGEQLQAIGTHMPALAALLHRINPRTVLHAPLLSGDRVVGLITLVTSADGARGYDAADVPFVEELARRCAVAVDKARAYEQAQNAIRARDAFMAILGHELRNPLAPITTALHLMKLRDARTAREQAVIGRQVKHLTRLIDDLLDVSRIERGKIELAKKPHQLAEIVSKAVEIASPLLEERRHRLHLEVSPTGLAVHADETRMAQVVANLLTNAARYTDEGGEIWVSATREGQQVVLRVRDNGIGMSPDLLPRVFDLFVQGARTPDRRLGGLGLGLSLVRSLVTLHGGQVAALSGGPGKGSEFIVRLPAIPVELVVDEAADEPSQSSIGGEGRRILVVDDNEDAAEMLREVLGAYGNEVLVAHDGPEALTSAPGFDPDVAILDIGLPVMDGYELARRLHATLRRQPVLIALTGFGQQGDRARARDAGFHEHLVKPVDPDRLIQLIERLAPATGVRAGQG